MKHASVIVVTRMKPPRKPLIYESIPREFERILVYGGVGSSGRCKNMGAKRAHTPALIFIDDDVEFYQHVLQRQVKKLEADPGRVITLGWRAWEAPTAFVVRRSTFDDIQFDPDLHLLDSIDFILRAQRKGLYVETPRSPYDAHHREFYDRPKAWFWYQFNQTAFMLKHGHIPQNAFNQKQKVIIKPLKFFFNPTTTTGIPTFYKSRRLLCRWMGVLYYGAKKLFLEDADSPA